MISENSVKPSFFDLEYYYDLSINGGEPIFLEYNRKCIVTDLRFPDGDKYYDNHILYFYDGNKIVQLKDYDEDIHKNTPNHEYKDIPGAKRPNIIFKFFKSNSALTGFSGRFILFYARLPSNFIRTKSFRSSDDLKWCEHIYVSGYGKHTFEDPNWTNYKTRFEQFPILIKFQSGVDNTPRKEKILYNFKKKSIFDTSNYGFNSDEDENESENEDIQPLVFKQNKILKQETKKKQNKREELLLKMKELSELIDDADTIALDSLISDINLKIRLFKSENKFKVIKKQIV